MTLSRRTFVTLACCALAASTWLVGLPYWTYWRLLSAPETGLRHGLMRRLKTTGRLGRCLARHYALKRTRMWPPYGHFLILYNRDLWIGKQRDDLRTELGPPDQVHGDVDVWLIGRHYALARARRDKNYTWDWAYGDWVLCLAGEYENGVLVRFGNPCRGGGYLDEIERSPYQTRYKIDLDPDLTNRPPPEWLAAKAETQQVAPEGHR